MRSTANMKQAGKARGVKRDAARRVSERSRGRSGAGRVGGGEQGTAAPGKDPQADARGKGVGAKDARNHTARRGAPHDGPIPPDMPFRSEDPDPAFSPPDPQDVLSGPVIPNEATLGEKLLGNPADTQFTPLPYRTAIARFNKPSIRSAGRDADGKIIPHERREDLALLVESYVRGGATENEICLMLNIRPGQLRQHYARELKVAEVAAHMRVAETIYAQASTPGNPRMSEFYAKARMGWDDDPKDKKNQTPFNIYIHT